tara:strand:+ start:2257 stop:4002 length:1746 start_codon:yes stop_codon:yes gene_type:complete
MFRQAGMSKQPMGILASSPELMNATKGYEKGGQVVKANVGKAFRANSLDLYGGNQSGGIAGAPRSLEDLKQFQMRNQIEPNLSSLNESYSLDKLNKDKADATAEKLQMVPTGSDVSAGSVYSTPYGIDNSLENANKINKINKSLSESTTSEDEANKFNVKRLKPLSFGTQNSETRTGDSTVTDLYGESVSENILAEQTNIANAYTKLSKNLANVNDMTFLGTTANKALQEQITLLKSEDKEFTIADAKKAFTKLGYKDDEALTEDFNEEREASFWLNMMKAGASMAAGTSSDTLQNFAKGFTTGLEGFGKDTGQLRKELREDKKEASKTIFNLLQNGKSERIATKALDLQKAAAISNIVSTQAGEEKTRLTNEVNNEVANRKLTISLFKTFADMNFEAKKFNVGREDVEAASNIAYAKMIPDDLKLLIASGEVEIIDNSRPDLLAPDNIKASPKGIKSIQLLLSNLKSGKITDTQVAIGTAGSVGKTNSGIVFDTSSENYNPNISGTAIKEYNKLRSELINSIGAENKQIAQQDVQFAKVNGGKIDLNLQTDKMLSIFTDQSKGQSFVDKNQNIFIPLKST